MAGPWTQFTRYLEVEVVDKTCLDTSVKKNKNSHEQCLLHQEKMESMTREMKIYNNLINNYVIRDHSYVASVSPCFDDGCFLAASSDVVTYSDTYTFSVIFDHAILTDMSTQLLTVDVLASVESEKMPSVNHSNLSCLYLWTVSTDISEARLVTNWIVQKSLNCSNIKVCLL